MTPLTTGSFDFHFKTLITIATQTLALVKTSLKADTSRSTPTVVAIAVSALEKVCQGDGP